MEWMGRPGRRRKQLLGDVKERLRYWKLKEEALDRTLHRTRVGRRHGPAVTDYGVMMTSLKKQTANHSTVNVAEDKMASI
jgi:hypothetical protein